MNTPIPPSPLQGEGVSFVTGFNFSAIKKPVASIVHRIMPTNASHSSLPILSLLYSATLWGVLWYPLRELDKAGLDGLWATLVLFGAALAVGGWLAFAKLRDVGGAWPALLAMGLANGWCNVAFIVAILDGNVVRVTLLFFLSPLWATLLARVLLGERISLHAWGVLGLALGGAVIMLWNPELGYPWPQSASDGLAISSGVAFALSNVLVRKTESAPLAVKTACAWLGVVLITLLWIAVSQTALPQVAAAVWWSAAALGVFAILTMTVAVQYGVSHMPVHRSAIILLFELVASAVSSQLLTHEIVQPHEWLGGALIALAAYFAARAHLENKHGSD